MDAASFCTTDAFSNVSVSSTACASSSAEATSMVWECSIPAAAISTISVFIWFNCATTPAVPSVAKSVLVSATTATASAETVLAASAIAHITTIEPASMIPLIALFLKFIENLHQCLPSYVNSITPLFRFIHLCYNYYGFITMRIIAKQT